MIGFIIQFIAFIWAAICLISTLMDYHSYNEAMKTIDKLEHDEILRLIVLKPDKEGESNVKK